MLDLFSNIWLGVTLLTLLFLYSSIGSVGIMVPGDWAFGEGRAWMQDISWFIPWTQVHLRQSPALEMTEFEWFHWWPFKLIMVLICLNIVVTTLRRIPLRPMNYGVWMIHTGILILCTGSLIYFSTKIEGDSPVIRRNVVARLPGFDPVSFPAIPGNRAIVGGGANAYMIEVWNVDPQWKIPSGEDRGQSAFNVTLSVQSASQSFMRQLVAGRPEFSQNLDHQHVVIELPGYEPVTMSTDRGSRATIGSGDDAYALEVWSVDPQWEILSGEDKGTRAFSVTVSLQTGGQSFMRQLVAGFPQYTEDVVRTDDPQQPMKRAKKINADGNPLVDETIALRLESEAVGDATLDLALDHVPQPYVYLSNDIAKSWALYVREQGRTEWVQRPVHGLPLYNDRIGDLDDVWHAAGDDPLPARPLDLEVAPSEDADPLPDMNLHITAYLRHAGIQSQRLPGGNTLDPAVSVRLANDRGAEVTYDLLAFDPVRSSAEQGRLGFRWVESQAEREALAAFRPRSLHISIPDTDIAFDAPIESIARINPDLPFTPVEGTPYAWRVSTIEDNLSIGGRSISVAMVEIRSGDEAFMRWAFNDPSMTRDLPLDNASMAHEHDRPLDEGIVITYDAGVQPAPVLVLAGPGDSDLGVQLTIAGRQPQFHPLKLDEPLAIDQGISLTVTRFAARTREVDRPLIVPRSQRDRDARLQNSMVRVEMPTGPTTQSLWVPYHHYAFRAQNEALRRFPYRPATVDLPDGRTIELILSRQRQPLPTPAILEDFQYTAHVGGFSGSNLSILDWTSSVRFAKEDGGWSDLLEVSVNDPAEYDGFWYFQAAWDPPQDSRGPGDRPSAGLNYTVLGVGNRHGVGVQLAGCIIAVIGMIYAFYIKPVIRRRRQAGVRAEIAARAAASATIAAALPEPAGALAGVGREETS